MLNNNLQRFVTCLAVTLGIAAGLVWAMPVTADMIFLREVAEVSCGSALEPPPVGTYYSRECSDGIASRQTWAWMLSGLCVIAGIGACFAGDRARGQRETAPAHPGHETGNAGA